MPLALLQYNQPFEDAPVVQMSTLTYETPQGTESPPPPFSIFTVNCFIVGVANLLLMGSLW